MRIEKIEWRGLQILRWNIKGWNGIFLLKTFKNLLVFELSPLKTMYFNVKNSLLDQVINQYIEDIVGKYNQIWKKWF